ncbi:HlyD family efflux transporter periplasmic adaptor subunit [Parasalinivibrio latis]|uniref:HlyD family secretion protein n=1 Tax=Parasalinivibrio latis TaxID=2952610 RepID=UPI0030E09D51
MTSTKSIMILLAGFFLSGCQQQEVNVALGTLEMDRYLVTAPQSETLVTLDVKEGQEVKKGQGIGRLDGTLAASELNRTKAALVGAKARLAELESGPRKEDIAVAVARVVGAEATLEDAVKHFTRTQSLVKRGVQGKAELDSARALRDNSEARLEEARQQLALLKAGTRAEQIEQAKMSVEEAQSKVEAAQHKYDDTLLTAPANGWIDSLPWFQGERIPAGAPVAVLLADRSPYARVYVPEPDRINLKVGQQLDVQVDGSETVFEGHVRWISSESVFTPYFALTENDRARLMYEMEVQLEENATGLPAGLPAQVVLP